MLVVYKQVSWANIQTFALSYSSKYEQVKCNSISKIKLVIMKHNQSPDQRWQTQKDELKLKFPFLIDADFRYDYGRKDVMMTRLQTRLGKSREDLNALLATL